MIQRMLCIYVCILFFNFQAIAQENATLNELSKAEIALLDFLSEDTVHDLNLSFFKPNIRFGAPPKMANGISLLKQKDEIYLQILGTGRLYQVQKKAPSNYQLIRIDSTYHFGNNFGAINGFYKDTLFQFGGIGFWHIKDYFTFFSQKTKEWELYTSDRKVPAYQNNDNGIVFKFDQADDKFYLSRSVTQQAFPSTLATDIVDSCFVFNFKTKSWKNLGEFNPSISSKLSKIQDLKTAYGPYLIFHYDLELYWLNFATNQFGSLSTEKQAEFREKWLKIYKVAPAHMYQFVLGDAFYLIGIEEDGSMRTEKIALAKKDFDDSNVIPVYKNNLLLSFLKMIEPGKPVIGNFLIIILTLLVYSYIRKRFKKNKIPSAIQSILYKNFFTSLTVIEKELLDAIYRHQIKEEQISIKTINKIMGVQQKDTITQNKSRSDYFLRINQKFKLATRATETLIVKEREQTDKRIYNYNINTKFILEIEKLILNN